MILETQRLKVRQFELPDDEFILELVNTPEWHRFIGDRGVRTVTDARTYLENGPLKSYREHGFGLWRVTLASTDVSIGMCGFLKRPQLDHPDIGFAFLTGYLGKGYGYEVAAATLDMGFRQLKFPRILAATVAENAASIALLRKLGMTYEQTLALSETNVVQVYGCDRFGWQEQG